MNCVSGTAKDGGPVIILADEAIDPGTLMTVLFSVRDGLKNTPGKGGERRMAAPPRATEDDGSAEDLTDAFTKTIEPEALLDSLDLLAAGFGRTLTTVISGSRPVVIFSDYS